MTTTAYTTEMMASTTIASSSSSSSNSIVSTTSRIATPTATIVTEPTVVTALVNRAKTAAATTPTKNFNIEIEKKPIKP